MEMQTEIPKSAYEVAQAKLLKRLEQLEKYREALALCERIRDEHYPDGEVAFRFSEFDIEINFAIYVDDLADAVPALRALRAGGHTFPRHCDSPETNVRMYISNPIRLVANLIGGKCRFEKIGVEEKPVYKIMCDGQEVLTDEVAS